MQAFTIIAATMVLAVPIISLLIIAVQLTAISRSLDWIEFAINKQRGFDDDGHE